MTTPAVKEALQRLRKQCLTTRTLLIDADIFCYQTVTEQQITMRNADDEYYYKVRLEDCIVALEARFSEMLYDLEASDLLLCFSSTNNWRRMVMRSYKANRTRRKPLGYLALRDWMTENYPTLEIAPFLEADDLLGLVQTGEHGLRMSDGTPMPVDLGATVIVSEDKDLRTIPGMLYNPRAPERGIEILSSTEARLTHMHQTLVGDVADNYPGLRGIGKVKANKILASADSMSAEDLWKAVLGAYIDNKAMEIDAIENARVSRILQHGDYNPETGEMNLWTPPNFS